MIGGGEQPRVQVEGHRHSDAHVSAIVQVIHAYAGVHAVSEVVGDEGGQVGPVKGLLAVRLERSAAVVGADDEACRAGQRRLRELLDAGGG